MTMSITKERPLVVKRGKRYVKWFKLWFNEGWAGADMAWTDNRTEAFHFYDRLEARFVRKRIGFVGTKLKRVVPRAKS